MNTPTPGDLSARLPELPEPELMTIKGRAFTATQMYLFAIKVRDAALSVLPAAGGAWQPITSVPRDGTRVVVWMPDGTFSSASYSAHSEPQGVYWMIPTTPQPSAAEEGAVTCRVLTFYGEQIAVPSRIFRRVHDALLRAAIDDAVAAESAAPAAGKGVDERTRFIAWANQRGIVAFDCEAAFGMEADDRFISPDTSLAWAAWQAALTRQPAITTDS